MIFVPTPGAIWRSLWFVQRGERIRALEDRVAELEAALNTDHRKGYLKKLEELESRALEAIAEKERSSRFARRAAHSSPSQQRLPGLLHRLWKRMRGCR